MSTKSKILALYQFVFDRVLAPVGWILAPVYLAGRAMDAAGVVFWHLHNEYLKRTFKACGGGVRLHGRFDVPGRRHLEVGSNVHINKNAFMRAEGGIRIGDNVHIGRNLVVYSTNHSYQGEALPYDHHHVHKPVTIGKNAWLGVNVTISPGVTIGDGAIVGMGSVISRDVPPGAIVGTNEMRIIKHRDPEHYERLEREQKYGGMAGYPFR